jgi:hypothetical protein
MNAKHAFLVAAALSLCPLTVSNGSIATKEATAQPMPPGLPDLQVRLVDDSPPRFRHEVRIQRPSRNHVWLKGHYDRGDRDWQWHEGRWAEPPARGVRWVAPRYGRYHGRVRYEPEHWSNEHLIDIR